MGGQRAHSRKHLEPQTVFDPLSLQAMPLHRFVPVANGILEGRFSTTTVLTEALALREAKRAFAAIR